MQYGIQKITIEVVLKMFLIAVVQTKLISCNSENKSLLLQVVHTKAITALTQFCDFGILKCLNPHDKTIKWDFFQLSSHH